MSTHIIKYFVKYLRSISKTMLLKSVMKLQFIFCCSNVNHVVS